MLIVLIEDDPVIASELRLRWAERGWSVRLCGTLGEASQAVLSGAPDLLVLDLNLPDGDGLAWLRHLRHSDTRTPVLVLTARDEIEHRVAGLRTGADDYLVKPFAVAELDARIEVLVRRHVQSIGRSVRFMDLILREDEGQVLAQGVALDLTRREVEVLALLLRAAPRMVSKRTVTDALAERNLDVSDGAAETYISRLRRKLEGTGVNIRTVRGFGYQLTSAAP